MIRVTIDLPLELSARVNTMSILELIEPGASGHALIQHRGDDWNEFTHSRLGVTIRRETTQPDELTREQAFDKGVILGLTLAAQAIESFADVSLVRRAIEHAIANPPPSSL